MFLWVRKNYIKYFDNILNMTSQEYYQQIEYEEY